jgi:uncharacterized membrane protein
MFVGTFVYCMAAALSIPPVEVEPESPQLTATVGLYLMLATFSTLILLVQHVSTMLQAPNIAAAAGADLLEVVNAEITEDDTPNHDDAVGLETPPGAAGAPRALAELEGYSVRITDTGYIQYIDPAVILDMARDKNLVIRLLHKPGHFVRIGEVVALVWPASQVDKQHDKLLRRAYQIGNVRTPTQDVEYAVNQLTEMAVRAMSPAINDPFTAMTCLDHIGAGLVEFIRRGGKGSHYYDRDGRLLLVMEPVTFAELLSAAFDMLRHASCDNASVLRHMLEVIDVIGQETESPTARQELLRHVNLIQAESQASKLIEQDQQLIARSSEDLLLKLEATPLEALQQ